VAHVIILTSFEQTDDARMSKTSNTDSDDDTSMQIFKRRVSNFV